MSSQETDDDAQLAADMQLAYELQAQEQEQQQQETIRRNCVVDEQAAAVEVVSTSHILGGGGGGGASPYASSAAPSSGNSGSHLATGSNSKTMFSRMGNALGSMTTRNNNHALLDDGSSAMASNGSLLYVPCVIKEIMVEMMVDSGSQTSVISSSMMKKLNLQTGLNRQYQGVASGVGSARILGRIDNCPVLIGAGIEFNLYFLVIDVPHDMMILGIDQMRRFKCLIDLEKNVLIFGGQGGVEVPFLPPDPNHADAREQCTVS